ncbi:MAG: NAD(P)-binding domain-containing protein [Flavipsychrobacter sp.]|nr:NAD(P)-binding domain-containing protein [Flavipsychrobacter sp.]
MNIAIIGNGPKVAPFAEQLAREGHTVFIGLNEDEHDEVLVSAELENIFFENIEDAGAQADVIYLAVTADKVRQVAYMLGDVRNKVIIDASANIDPKPEEYVATLKAAMAITGAEHMVKSYFLAPEFDAREAGDIFFAGNSKKAKSVAMLLANSLGFKNTYDFGDIDTVPLLEDMARCWYNLAIKQNMGKEIMFKIVKR